MRSTPRLSPVALLLFVPLAWIGSQTADAAAELRFRPEGRYRSGVPAPTAVIGRELGGFPVRHDEIVRYAEALAESSPRVVLRRHAVSHEGRDLVHLLITSEENHARLDRIRADLARLADPRSGLSSRERDRLIETTPAVAYMAYAIHGDELSSADAALRLAYELAAGEDELATRLRENLVVIVEPVENPDGRDRILSMLRSYSTAVPNPDPEALSHTGFWPWGRTNHYLFDLNRDWFALVHPESRGRADIQRNWNPQLVVDSHEMGSSSTYLFSPPRDPFNPNLPSATLPWWERFAADQARAFDAQGWSYYTREWNEEFYPGYGSALALYRGAVGILYEQARTAGQPTRKPSGRIETFADAIRHQLTSSMANLTSAADYRQELLGVWREARAEAIRRGRAGPVRAFYFAPRPDPARAEALAARLARNGIEVERLERDGTLAGARDFFDDGARSVRLPAGSFRVRLDQPDGLLARAILEPHTPMPDSSLAEEREHLERGKETRVYDVTAWSPLAASGLESWWTGALDRLEWVPFESERRIEGGLDDGPASYGWIFDGTPDAAVVLAAHLAARGFQVRAAQEPVTIDGRRYPRGSFLVRAEDNPEATGDSLAALAERLGVGVRPLASARILEGPDLGGDLWPLLRESRIALLAAYPIEYYSLGAAWHLLDRIWGVRASLLDAERVLDYDLERYNVLVLPHAWDGVDGYRQALSEKTIAALDAWVESGGTLVAMGSGAELAADTTSKLSRVKRRSQWLEEFPPPRFGLGDERIAALERPQGMGLGRAGRGVPYAGLYEGLDRRGTLAIPGPGSPLLGPGTWAALGAAGEAARRRGVPEPIDESATLEAWKELGEEELKAARKRRDDRLRRFQPSGALLRVDLDPEHWLAYGAGTRLTVMLRSVDALLARDPVATPARFAEPGRLHVGGLLWPEAAGRIAQTAYLTREEKKRGQVILFAWDPNFRGYFWGPSRLFLNAVLLGPGLGTDPTTPW